MSQRLEFGRGLMAAVAVLLGMVFSSAAASQCFPDATDVSGSLGISNVQLGVLQNNTGGATNHYTDYTSLTPPNTPIVSQQNLLVTASTGFTIAVWIDWNQDNLFAASEKLPEAVSTDSVVATVITFTVPGGVMTGNARMRIRAIQGVTGVDPCTSAPAVGDRGETEDYVINVTPAIQVSTSTLPVAEVGLNYTATIQATGGIGTLTWALTGGVLPNGLVFLPAGGLVGVPLAGSNNVVPYALTFSVTDQATPANVASVTLNLLVQAFTGLPLSIVTTSLPNAVTGQSYSQTVVAVNGANPNGSTTPYNFSITGPGGGSLPPGLGLTPAGQILGVPTLAGVFSFQVEVEDPAQFVATQNLTITVLTGTGGGGGGGGGGTNPPISLEGGGGCVMGGRSHAWMVAGLALILTALVVRRRRAA
jgi:hypothetical protein